MVWTHMERMDEYHTARRVLMAEVSGARVRGSRSSSSGSSTVVVVVVPKMY